MRRIVLVVMCGILLGSASPALAGGNPSCGAYCGPANNQLNQVGGQSANSGPGATSKGSLPFTGLNVGIVAVIAVALVASGFALRIRIRSDID